MSSEEKPTAGDEDPYTLKTGPGPFPLLSIHAPFLPYRSAESPTQGAADTRAHWVVRVLPSPFRIAVIGLAGVCLAEHSFLPLGATMFYAAYAAFFRRVRKDAK